MKLKIFLLLVSVLFFLNACGTGVDRTIKLMDHDGNEVLFPSEKPVLFFFITTFT